DELRTPSGKNILRDAPWDHLHHHALMYAIRVDGHNFWEEGDPRAGKQIMPGSSRLEDGEGRHAVCEEVYWEVLADAESTEPIRLLSERRIVSIYHSENDVTLLSWASLLRATNDVVLSGAHYHGLGLRFVEEMDTGGRFFSDSDTNVKEIVRGDEALTRCRWMAYTAKLDGQPVTVAVFDHPRNTVPMTAFTMGDASDAFAYLSATMNLHREPVNLKAGERFDVFYLIAVWDGEVSPETVEAKYREFVR
ncbi:MAG: PmoA family protein, partial [Planctomycetaceae bacterium]|nr:PmoA family protein [Planctomycetaceae bacterium]